MRMRLAGCRKNRRLPIGVVRDPLRQAVDPDESLAATARGCTNVASHEYECVAPFVLCADATRRRRSTAEGSASQEPNAEVALVGGGEDGVMPLGERSAAGDHPALGVMADGLELPHTRDPFEVSHVFAAIAEHAVDGVVETHEP